MSGAFLKGCHRVGGVITRSPDLSAIVARRVPDELNEIAAAHGADLSSAYKKYLKGRIRTVRAYDVAGVDICFFGKTANNMKEFTFLLEVLDGQGVRYTHCFLMEDLNSFPIAAAAVPRRLSDIVFDGSAQWIRESPQVTGTHLHQHLRYARTFLGVLYSFERKRHLLPRVAVVANDHSPAQVGFAAAMQSLGVPVIYVQHAQVSEIFPPLDFEAAVLRNAVSLDTYRRIGPVGGQTFVLSRSRGPTLFDKVLERPKDNVIVGIYPTSYTVPGAVRRAVDALRSNPAVDDYFVKPHPNSPERFSEEEAEYLRVRGSIPDQRHVAIVGNSSIVVELLGRGHVVHQLFELDRIKPDYYGFVRAGLVPAVEIEDLGRSFWLNNFYDEAWLARAVQFEPAIAEDQDLVKRELAAFLRDLLRRPRRLELRSRLLDLMRRSRVGGLLRLLTHGKLPRSLVGLF